MDLADGATVVETYLLGNPSEASIITFCNSGEGLATHRTLSQRQE
jgi:hypothetical protein